MNKYNNINKISNYLSLNINDQQKYDEIIKYCLNNEFENPINLQIIQEPTIGRNEKQIKIDSMVFYKFAKESIYESLSGENRFYYKYKPREMNEYHKIFILDIFKDIGFNFDENTKKSLKIDPIKINKNGLFFFESADAHLIASNFINFGETLVIGISDPQILKNTIIQEIHKTDLKANNIYCNDVISCKNSLLIKEIINKINDSKNIDLIRYLEVSNISNQPLRLVKLQKKILNIDFFESNISKLNNFKNIQDLDQYIDNNIKNYEPQIYKESICFLQKLIDYFEKLHKTLFPIANNFSSIKEFIDYTKYSNSHPEIRQLNKQKLIKEFIIYMNKICPGQLNLFDEKYQLEKFRDECGSAEFKNQFLNNFNKPIYDKSNKEIQQMILGKKSLFSSKNKAHEILNKILKYNKLNQNKQIPILLFATDLKENDKNKLSQINEIIDFYIKNPNNKINYIYNYLVKEESLDDLCKELQTINNFTDFEHKIYNTLLEKNVFHNNKELFKVIKLHLPEAILSNINNKEKEEIINIINAYIDELASDKAKNNISIQNIDMEIKQKKEEMLENNIKNYNNLQVEKFDITIDDDR